MARNTISPGEDALVKALKSFQDQKSGLYKNVHNSLSALQTSHAGVLSRFTARAAQRQRQAAELNAAPVASAKTYLDEKRKYVVEMRKFGHKVFIETAEIELAVAEKMYANVVALSKLSSSVVADNGADDTLRDWYDGLVAHVANSVRDSASFDEALAVVNGGLIVLGVALGPVAAAPLAIVSAVLLAVDLRAKLHKIKEQDEATARLEGSILMIDAANDIGKRWLTIL